MVNIYIENHYADLVKKEHVVKLLATRDSDLKHKSSEHINRRVDEKSPPNAFDTPEVAVPETIRCQALAARTEELLQLKKSLLSDGKESVGHDVGVSDVNDAFASVRPSIVVGERDTSQGVPMNLQAQAAFINVSSLQVRMGHEFENQCNSEYLS